MTIDGDFSGTFFFFFGWRSQISKTTFGTRVGNSGN